MLKAQVGEGDALEGIEGHTNGHHTDIFGVGGIAHPLGNRPEAQQNCRHKRQSHTAHSNERGGIDAQRLRLALLVDKAEEGGLHAEREQHQQEGYVTINFGDNAITARFHRQFGGIERYEQIIEKAAHDTAHAIYHGVLHQGFQSSHILGFWSFGFECTKVNINCEIGWGSSALKTQCGARCSGRAADGLR